MAVSKYTHHNLVRSLYHAAHGIMLFADCRAPGSQLVVSAARPLPWGCARVQGTTQQLAAVAALHSLNWRFHTALKTWFQWPSSHQVTPRVRCRETLELPCFMIVRRHMISLTYLALVAPQ